MSAPLVVSFGGGVNSAAMLVGMRERGIRPDVILFSDTGGEKPETYESVREWSAWCSRECCPSFPGIKTIRANSADGTLEGACIKNRSLPSVAYGFKTCSLRWKLEPQEKFMRRYMTATHVVPTRYRKAIGIDAGEPHRVKQYEDADSETWFPLVEWGWRREDCVAAIEASGMPVPAKSACFFCPSSRKSEVLWLKQTHPDLYWRAVSMERSAEPNFNSVKGLGRHWSWEALGATDEQQFKLWPETVSMPCMCFDGEDDAA